MTDPAALTRAVTSGLLDAPQLRNNKFGCGRMRTSIINGACVAVDAKGKILREKKRLSQPDLGRVVTLDLKSPGDLLYLVGETRPELGGSEFYEMLGYVGLSVPQVRPQEFLARYRIVEQAIAQGLLASCRTLTRGGLAVHLALAAMAGGLGVEVDLGSVAEGLAAHVALYSESAGRFLVSVAPDNRARFEAQFHGQPCALLGQVSQDETFVIKLAGSNLVETRI